MGGGSPREKGRVSSVAEMRPGRVLRPKKNNERSTRGFLTARLTFMKHCTAVVKLKTTRQERPNLGFTASSLYSAPLLQGVPPRPRRYF